jgi:cell volume regulation protein A
VFALLRASATRLNERVAATLEIESGVNDPMAVFLTLGMLEFVRSGARYPGAELLWALAQQFALGAAGGLAFGFALSALAKRIRPAEGLNAIFIAAGGVLSFAAINAVGGSGFLAVYLTGLVVGNRALLAGDHVLRAMDGLAWLAQSGMFLMLGLLVTPSTALALAWPALLVSLLLIVVARPVAVWVSLVPFRLPWREIGYLSWVGLRGAVPIVLAVYPTMAGIPGARMFFDAAFFVVLVSLLLQGSTVGVAARWLRVGVPPAAEPVRRVAVGADAGEPVELVEVEIGAGCRAIGAAAEALALPAGTRAVSVARGDRLLYAGEAGALAAGDKLLVLSPASHVALLLGLFAPHPEHGPFEERAFFGEFALDAAAQVADVEDTYGVRFASDDERRLSLAAFLSRRLHGRPVLGDRVESGALALTVRGMQGAAIISVGLKLPRSGE